MTIHNLQSESVRQNSRRDGRSTLSSRVMSPARSLLRSASVALVQYPKYGQDIRDRCFRFACAVVQFCRILYAQGGVGRILAPQLVRCSTSVGANLEEARGGESRGDFVSKCAISLKEAREARFRLRVVEATGFGPPTQACALADEAEELAAILGAIVRNAKRHRK